MKASRQQVEKFFRLVAAQRRPKSLAWLRIEVKGVKGAGHLFRARRTTNGVNLTLHFTPGDPDWKHTFNRALDAACEIFDGRTTAVEIALRIPESIDEVDAMLAGRFLPAPLRFSPFNLEVPRV